MNTDSYRRSHLHKGLGYHKTFSSWSYRSTIWLLEQRVLLEIVGENLYDEPPRYLDFACGTGRILGHLTPHCRSAVGVDVSASMLEVARGAGTRAEIIEVDITRDNKLDGREFDLITAFRFFPNAERELRKGALAALTRLLSSDGILVFNNHKNAGSLRRRLGSAKRRVVRRSAPESERRTMSDIEARNLVADVGLHIHRVYHLAVLPFGDHTMWLPQGTITSIERALSRLPFTEPMAQNLIYVCRRSR